MERNNVLSDSQHPSNKQDQGSSSITPQRVQRLEQFYEECRFPSIAEAIQLSDELGIKPNEILLWFKDRREQTKAQEDLSEIVILRRDNEKLRLENSVLKDNLVTATTNCSSCHDSSVLQANVEYQLELSEARNQAMLNMQNIGSDDFVLLMHETARRSTEELIKLLTAGEMFWVDSNIEGQNVLNLANYKRNLASSYYFLHNDICKESSKASCIVHMKGKELVDKMLDPKKRMILFPLIMSDSHMAYELAVGDTSTRSGYSQLVYEHVHALSPFIQHRWFYILRHCQQIEDGKWVIADISSDYYKSRSNAGPLSHVKHPSGCMIQDLGNGFSKVTWVEHVGVDRRSRALLLHLFYIQSGLAYGAKHWVSTLKTTVERNLNMIATYLNPTFETKINAPWLQCTLERRKMLVRCNSMMRRFYSSLFLSDELKVIQHTIHGQDEAQIAIRKNPDQDSLGFAICASTSVLIPVSANVLFDFLCDADKRSKWDNLCRDGAHILAKIPMGEIPGNDVSIIKPLQDVSYVIIQEASSYATGKHISFAPYKARFGAMSMNTTRSEHPRFAWLPSGFTIFDIGHPSVTRRGEGLWPYGCVLTTVFNYRSIGNVFPRDLNLITFDHVRPALRILTSAVGRIKMEVCREQ